MSTLEPHSRIEQTLSAFRAIQPECDDAPPAVRLATQHIHDRLFEPDLTVQQLRDRLGLTDPTFFARFRQYHGCTPAAYIRRLRVEATKRLFRHHEELRSSDVALLVGYEYYRTFARVFKRVTGQSPQAYRHEWESG